MPQLPAPSTLLVTKIIAGSGITVTPAGGTGLVTVSTSGATETFASITGSADPFPIGGKAGATNTAGGALNVAGGAGNGTGAGGATSVTGGVGGATSGAGGNATVSGGAAGTGSNANGGDANISGGAKDGTGVNGVIRHQSIVLNNQGAPGSQDTAATLTAAQILAGILTSNPSGAVNLQLPLATAMDTALPTSAAGDSFDFSVISIAGSTNLPTLTTNTGWTLVGAMTFTAVAGNAGRLRARKTGTGAWTLYRLA